MIHGIPVHLYDSGGPAAVTRKEERNHGFLAAQLRLRVLSRRRRSFDVVQGVG
jgi:hypothetical protein